MNRRDFVIAAAAVAVAPAIKERPVMLYADGDTDDTAALQSWMYGRDAVWSDGTPVGDHIAEREFCVLGQLQLEGTASYRSFTHNRLSGLRGA
jgi:hypothetical protein